MNTIKVFFSNLFGTVVSLLTSTGFAYLGYGGGALAVILLTPKTWFWGLILGLFVGFFLMKNATILKPWADKQVNDIKNKIGL